MKFSRKLTSDRGVDSSIWELRDARILGADGAKVFEQKDVEVPKFWNDNALRIVASKYFKTINGVPEKSVKDLIARVVDTICKWGSKDKYFTTSLDKTIFHDELTHILTYQYAAFNTPVWLNLGVPTRPQTGAACFLIDVEDSLDSINDDWYTTELKIFKAGAGSGLNVSKLRHRNAALSGGGVGSGPVSFMKAADYQAGVIKSGGTARRSAKMVVMNVDHPDIEEFVTCKTKEEAKAKALIAAGYDSSFEGEAYSTVAFQNTNHSVRVTKEFMQKVVDGNPEANHLIDLMAEEAWKTGDPGIQYQDTIDKYYTVPACGPQVTSNVCQPDFATALTPYGITTFKHLHIGDTIWSGKRWTKVVNKVYTGVKPVFKYETTAGYFLGTEDHRVVSKGIKIPVKDADFIDMSVGPDQVFTELDLQDVMDGWVLGDGSVHKASNNLVYLNIGQDDGDIFNYLPEYITKAREAAFNGFGYEIKTTITDEELPRTYNRLIPGRFRFGNESKVRGFLRGLFSANGTVCGGRVSLRATSFSVIEAAQEMLSSLGIASYYTTSKSRSTTHHNGTYVSKESYDLNITRDKDKFQYLIGFVQDYKNEKLSQLNGQYRNFRKTSYEIRVVESVGDHKVYDITVDDPEHTYWTGGVLVSNCSEIFQNSWSACTLCCINLLKFQTEAPGYDYDLLRHVVSTITVALDIIVANSDYPDERIAQNSKNQRHIGIGYCNLGALLMTEGVAYDSDEGRHLAAKLTSYITGQAYNTSANIASDLGPFEDFEANKGKMLDVIKLHNDSSSQQFMDETLATLWSDTVTKGVLYGYRNAHVTALMPSGTVAFMMGADTTGVEPTIALTIYKNMVGGGSFKLVSPLVPKALESLGYFGTEKENVLNYFEKNSTLIGSSLSNAELPVFATSFGDIPLSPMAHVKMVAAVQPYVSQGISKTVNLPSTATVAEIKQVYIESWNLGLKSVAVYRDGCKATQPLNTKKEEVKIVVPEVKSNRAALPDERPAIIHKIEIGDFEGYLHVGLYANGQPGELFIDASKVGSSLQGLLDAFATSVSYSLQYGVPLEVLVEKFTNWRFEPAGFTKNKDIPMTSSVIDYIFRWLEHKFIKPINREETAVSKVGISTGELCTTCGSLMIRTGTCFSCSQCGKAGGCG